MVLCRCTANAEWQLIVHWKCPSWLMENQEVTVHMVTTLNWGTFPSTTYRLTFLLFNPLALQLPDIQSLLCVLLTDVFSCSENLQGVPGCLDVTRGTNSPLVLHHRRCQPGSQRKAKNQTAKSFKCQIFQLPTNVFKKSLMQKKRYIILKKIIINRYKINK